METLKWVLNPWAWRRGPRHQRLLQAIRDDPSSVNNLDRVLAYVAELGAHDPRAVIEYIDKEVPAPNEPVIAEYLKALTKTDALSQYTSQGPLKEGADHQSLAQLLLDLSKKLQGEPIEALNVGTTIRRPLHVFVQDQSKARKKHRIKRAASFLLYLVLAPLMIFGLGGFALSYGVLKGGSLTWASLSDPADVNKTTEGLADAWSQATNAWSDSMNKTLSKMGFDSFEDLWAESLGRGSDNKPHVFDQAMQGNDSTPWAFDEIKGCDEAKHELQEIVQLMQSPEQLLGVKAHPPKGVLLVGPPGTGKTSLAKAVAAEAGFPFLYRAGSEFQNEFAGSGAKRVRALFEAARAAAPCIIFIDELDSVGSRSNYGGWGMGHDTVNQLLAEMDGFKPTGGILVLAATNFKESLDKALTRPGRFDRIVQLTLPDMQGRLEILEHYMKEKPQDLELDLVSIARSTTGWSGADLSNLVNEAALAAVSEDITHLTTDLLTKAMEKVIMGLPRRSGFMTAEAKNQTAYHEAGHVIVSMYTEGSNAVHKATIVPHGPSQGMVVQSPTVYLYAQRPDEDWLHHSKAHLQASLDFAVAGRAATELAFEAGGVTAGAMDDFKQATSLARAMVTKYGMSDTLGLSVGVEAEAADGTVLPLTQPDIAGLMYLGESNCHPGDNCEPLSTETRWDIETEVKSMLKNALTRAKALLVHKQTELDKLAQALITYETLSGTDMQGVLDGTFERSLLSNPRVGVGLNKARESYEMDKECQGNLSGNGDTPAQQVVKGYGDGNICKRMSVDA